MPTFEHACKACDTNFSLVFRSALEAAEFEKDDIHCPYCGGSKGIELVRYDSGPGNAVSEIAAQLHDIKHRIERLEQEAGITEDVHDTLRRF